MVKEKVHCVILQIGNVNNTSEGTWMTWINTRMHTCTRDVEAVGVREPSHLPTPSLEFQGAESGLLISKGKAQRQIAAPVCCSPAHAYAHTYVCTFFNRIPQ